MCRMWLMNIPLRQQIRTVLGQGFFGWSELQVSIWRRRCASVESCSGIPTRTFAERSSLVRISVPAEGFQCDEEGISSEGERTSWTLIRFRSISAVRALLTERGCGSEQYVRGTSLPGFRGGCAGARSHRIRTSLSEDLSSVPSRSCRTFPAIVGIRPDKGKPIPTPR